MYYVLRLFVIYILGAIIGHVFDVWQMSRMQRVLALFFYLRNTD